MIIFISQVQDLRSKRSGGSLSFHEQESEAGPDPGSADTKPMFVPLHQAASSAPGVQASRRSIQACGIRL